MADESREAGDHRAVGEPAHLVCGSAQDQDFEAVVGVQVHVGRRDYLFVPAVLDLHQASRKVWLAVVVDKRQHAHSRA